MSAPTYTPGPWRAVKTAHGPIDVFDARDHDVVTVYGGRMGNARLIAAAPELLEALKAMVLNDRHTYRDCHKAAVAAITKAEGRP